MDEYTGFVVVREKAIALDRWLTRSYSRYSRSEKVEAGRDRIG